MRVNQNLQKKIRNPKTADKVKIRLFQIHAEKLLLKRQIKSVIKTVLKNENTKDADNLNVVLTTNAEIRSLNFRFFKKNEVTDVIAFPLQEPGIWGEIYVCVDQAIERAEEFSVTPKEELTRLIIHGVLHLCGYDDSNKKEKAIMHQKEDVYLSELNR